MKFKIALYPSEEGFAASALNLPGCWSQGETEEEAIVNITDAIREFLEAEVEPEADEVVVIREVEVSLGMAKLPGVNHLEAVRALEKAGFRTVRQGKHIVMTNGARKVIIPRHNPINAMTMGAIVRTAGLTIDEFRRLL